MSINSNIILNTKVRCTLCDRVVMKNSFDRHERTKTHRMNKRLRIRELERILQETQDFDVSPDASVAETESTCDWDGSISEYEYQPVSLDHIDPEITWEEEVPQSKGRSYFKLLFFLFGVCMLMGCSQHRQVAEWGRETSLWINEMKTDVMGCSVAGVSVATLYEVMNRMKTAYGVLRYGVQFLHEAQKRAQA
jgi:hypothetical protein